MEKSYLISSYSQLTYNELVTPKPSSDCLLVCEKNSLKLGGRVLYLREGQRNGDLLSCETIVPKSITEYD